MGIIRRIGLQAVFAIGLGTLVLISCSKPPPVAFVPAGVSVPVAAVAVATQAAVLQARYGCTMFGCRQGFECDPITKSCRPLAERSASPARTGTRNTCVGSADRRVSLCVSSIGPSSFQIHAENIGPKVVVLALRGLRAWPTASCAPSPEASGQNSPEASGQKRALREAVSPSAELPVQAVGLRFATPSDATPREPRDALFLSPGPAVDVEVVFENSAVPECATELHATFAVGDGLLELVLTQPVNARK